MAPVAQHLLNQRRFEELEALSDAALAVGKAKPCLDQSPAGDQVRQPLGPIARRARQVVGLELERPVKALGELVVGALQQELAVGEPGGEAPRKRLRPPRQCRACNRAMLLQPVEHQRAGALRCLGGACRAQVA